MAWRFRVVVRVTDSPQAWSNIKPSEPSVDGFSLSLFTARKIWVFQGVGDRCGEVTGRDAPHPVLLAGIEVDSLFRPAVAGVAPASGCWAR